MTGSAHPRLGHASPAPAATRRLPGWIRPRVVFLGLVLVVLAGYTEMAFALEWRTNAGRIGPGFFPRILGIAGLVVTAWSLVTALRAPAAGEEVVAPEDEAAPEDEVGEADLGRHPRLLALVVAAAAVFVTTLVLLGAIVSSALFLAGTLRMLNRSHPVVNGAIAIGLPLAMYLVFDTALNAGLPAGVLPFL